VTRIAGAMSTLRRLFQSLSERNSAQLPLRVALNVLHHYCDPPQSITLLRARRARPRDPGTAD